MKHKNMRRTAALLLAGAVSLALAACGDPGAYSDPVRSVETESAAASNVPDASSSEDGKAEFVYSESAQLALHDLRSYQYQEYFAAAYLGFREENDPQELAAWIQDQDPALAAVMPFLTEIPEEHVIGSHGDLYCIVPFDTLTSLAVDRVEWEVLGNGTQPHVTGELYRCEQAQPILVYVSRAGLFPDEMDTLIHAVDRDGGEVFWYPEYDPESGWLRVPTDENENPLIFDFSFFDQMGDMWWAPPTALGLAGTWVSENGWMLEFDYDENAANGSGDMVLYQPAEGEDGTILTPYYDGTWWMDDDRLCLGVYNGVCPFPLLISPSGEQLVVMQADDGSVLPFFERGQTSAGLTRSYG